MSSVNLSSLNPHFYPQALLQVILLKQRLGEKEELDSQIEVLKQKLYTLQSKHRRCDRQIQKSFQCHHCKKVYASEVALKLHYKLKHQHESSSKTVKDKGQSTQAEETQHVSESNLSQQKLLIQQN